MNKICGYTCEHNKGGVCQITMCDKKIVMTTTTNEPFEQKFNVKYDEQGVEKFARWSDPTIEEYKKEIDRLNKKYNKALEILNEYGMPCERDNFNLLDTDYCEINCSNDEEQFKKCWDEFIKWRLGDKE